MHTHEINGVTVDTAPPAAPDATVMCVSPDDALKVWPFVEGYLRAAQEAGGLIFDPGSIQMDLKNRLILLWVAVKDGRLFVAAMLTRLMMGKDGIMCEILALGGKGALDLMPFLPQIEAYARAENCVKIKLHGRIGWTRVLDGFIQTGVILEKAL